MAKQKENPVDSNAFNNPLLKWLAPKFLRYERGALWFTIMGLVDASLLAYAYLTDSKTMLAVFAILPIVLILEHLKKPENVEVIISEYGIKFGELAVPFSRIKKFWILYNPPLLNELHILTDSRFHPEITIQLTGVNPVILRQYLVTQIPEWEGKQVSLGEMFIRFLRLN